jgi:hypothetical protein
MLVLIAPFESIIVAVKASCETTFEIGVCVAVIMAKLALSRAVTVFALVKIDVMELQESVEDTFCP